MITFPHRKVVDRVLEIMYANIYSVEVSNNQASNRPSGYRFHNAITCSIGSISVSMTYFIPKVTKENYADHKREYNISILVGPDTITIDDESTYIRFQDLIAAINQTHKDVASSNILYRLKGL